MPQKTRTTWTTLDEINWIFNIDKHRTNLKFSKLELLKEYKKSFKKRKEFGSVNKELVYIFLERELDRLEE